MNTNNELLHYTVHFPGCRSLAEAVHFLCDPKMCFVAARNSFSLLPWNGLIHPKICSGSFFSTFSLNTTRFFILNLGQMFRKTVQLLRMTCPKWFRQKISLCYCWLPQCKHSFLEQRESFINFQRWKLPPHCQFSYALRTMNKDVSPNIWQVSN